MADKITFKVYMTKEGTENDKPEIRRFAIDSQIPTNFQYLSDKLQAIYSNLRGRRFTVFWQDEEGDKITIDSDEELQLALQETHSVQKFYVTLHSSDKNDKVGDQTNDVDNSKTLHVDVICDGCEENVYRFRYKCLQCPDYDLCSDCEAKGLHAQHCMIRLNVPLQWKSHYKRRLCQHINKFCENFINVK